MEQEDTDFSNRKILYKRKQTLAMEVKISTKKKSGNDIACFNENRKMLDHIQASIHKEQIKASPSNMSNTHFPPLQIIPIYIYIYIYIFPSF